MANVFNRCLEQRTFPSEWKRVRLETKQTPGGAEFVPTVMHVGLRRKTARKDCRYAIKSNICERNRILTPNQYGFRRGKSTIDAISHIIIGIINVGLETRSMVGILTLDVRNAFNCMPCGHVIASSLQGKRVPGYLCRLLDNYFEKRVLIYDASGSTRTRVALLNARFGVRADICIQINI